MTARTKLPHHNGGDCSRPAKCNVIEIRIQDEFRIGQKNNVITQRAKRRFQTVCAA
jgi:hypothetical protein